MSFWIDDELAGRRRQGLYRVRRRVQFHLGAHIRYRHRDFLQFASNDYLQLAGDPRLAHAAARAARKYGCGAGASPLVTGWSPPLRALERDLAQWEGTESALVFSSGFAANVGLVSSLAGRGDAVFSDAFNHASLIDGCRLSQATIHIYRHADAGHLADLLRTAGGAARRRLIVSDTHFSMDGDFAPVAQLIDLAEEFDGLLLLDEAHATGVVGENGEGLLTASKLPESGRVVKVGTLSKALGGQGGFACGSRALVNWLVNRARPYVYSTALAPPLAAAGRKAVELVQAEPERRRHLLAIAEHLRNELQAHGFPKSKSRCQIIPLVVGELRAALEWLARLEERGLLVPAIRPPSVPVGTARLRISLTAGHTEEDVARLVTALVECRDCVGSAR